MKKISFYCIIALAFLLSSCKGELKEYGIYWGKQVSFKNFLGCNYTPDTLKQTLHFNVDGLTEPLEFGLYDTYMARNENNPDENRQIEQPVYKVAEFYVNGKLCNGHKFKVYPDDESVELGIVFLPDAEKKDYYWVLKVEDPGNADMINDSLIKNGIPVLFTWKADYDTKMNPLALGLLLAGIAILACLFLWICILKFMLFERFRVKNIIIEDKESERKIIVRGALSLTLTNKVQKQGVFERIFKGRRLYFRDEFFADGDIVIKPRNRKTVRLTAPEAYNMVQYTISRDDEAPLVIKNSSNQQKELRVV